MTMNTAQNIGFAQPLYTGRVTEEAKESSRCARFAHFGDALCNVMMRSAAIISFAVVPGAATGAATGALMGAAFAGIGAGPGAAVGAAVGGCVNVVGYVGFVCALSGDMFRV